VAGVFFTLQWTGNTKNAFWDKCKLYKITAFLLRLMLIQYCGKWIQCIQNLFMQNAFTFTFSEVWISIAELSFKMYAMKDTDVTARTSWCIKNTIKEDFYWWNSLSYNGSGQARHQ
jgi:hypothetical protein